MDCDGAIERVYTYLDGELTVWKRQAITRHLDECPPCSQGFSFEFEIRRVIATRCRDEAPADLRRRIAESIDRARPPER